MELLVVMAIISMLATLILPALRSAQRKAQQISCTNNLKQIGIAAGIYVDENRTYPHSEIAGTWHRWHRLLDPYCGQPSVFVCRTDPDVWLVNGMGLSYVANYAYFAPWDHRPRTPGKISKPSCKIMIGPNADGPTNSSVATAQYAAGVYDGDGANNGHLPWSRVSLTRHDGQANYLFGDVHVQALGVAQAMDKAQYWQNP